MMDITPADPDDTAGTDPTKFDPTAAPGEDENTATVPQDHDGDVPNGGTK